LMAGMVTDRGRPAEAGLGEWGYEG
jgi:hypothetical protein